MDTPKEETTQSMIRSNVVRTPPIGSPAEQGSIGSDLGSSRGQTPSSSGQIFMGRFPRPMPPNH